METINITAKDAPFGAIARLDIERQFNKAHNEINELGRMALDLRTTLITAINSVQDSTDTTNDDECMADETDVIALVENLNCINDCMNQLINLINNHKCICGCEIEDSLDTPESSADSSSIGMYKVKPKRICPRDYI